MFHKGRPVSLPQIQWTSSEEWASVDESNMLFLSGSGALTLNARVVGEPSITASVSTLVSPEIQVALKDRQLQAPSTLYPNPARDLIHVSGVEKVNISLYESTGKLLMQIESYTAGDPINIQKLSPGLYLLKVGEGRSASFLKLLKH
jgi:hypothetical protein